MAFKDRLKAWRGALSLKEAAAALDIDYPTYRKYETGKRTPCKLALAEIERRMVEDRPENPFWKKRAEQIEAALRMP